MRTPTFPSALVIFLTLTGCEAATDTKGCTEIGCVNGFTVDFQTGTWPAGTYVVYAVTQTTTSTCTVKLPFASIDPGTVCTGDKFQLGTSGSALPAAQHSLVGVSFFDTPAEVTLTVKRDATQLATQKFTPAYKTSTPNGAGCEPTCTQANATLKW
ncbi:MAG: hypothetical protein EXR79_17145 [Myxococcales bacterium]|nr:hypothetical protein [Myxococcales bacterium]